MTPQEWEAAWAEEYAMLRKLYPTAALQIIQKAAVRRVEARLGPKPTEGGAPLLVKITAFITGVSMLSKLWTKVDGWKTTVGIVITILAFASDNAQVILNTVGVDAVMTAKIVGVLVTVVGVAHKIYKWTYKEDHV